jgi:choline-sulfatase
VAGTVLPLPPGGGLGQDSSTKARCISVPALVKRRPNLLVLITDQQRYPRHWPGGAGFVRELMPADAELARTGLSFTRAFVNTCMCSPSRATLFTGLLPARHGVTLTLTAGDLQPDRRNLPWVLDRFGRGLVSPEVPRQRIARAFVRGLLRRGTSGGDEPELDPAIPNVARLLRDAGYRVALKGKWHLTRPLDAEAGWSEADAERIDRELGFGEWEPPDAGENVKPANFGGGNAGRSSEGWDEDYVRQVERFLAEAAEREEPFALVVSLVNPHDVLAYPASYADGGYTREEIPDLGVDLPPTTDEDLSAKPSAHALMKLGQLAYLGPLRGDRARLDYVNFYAYLHRLVDRKVARVLDALGDPAAPESLRSRTIVVRTSDHGEMGLAHGGLRQKMFNVYEETVHVPLVVSNPVLFPEPVETGALASLIDLAPTLATLAGAGRLPDAQGVDLAPVLAQHAARPLDGVAARPSVQDTIHFTYDDHQAGTAQANVPGQPNRVRCVLDGRWKYAIYFDPDGDAPTEHELYDLDRDPNEVRNLVDFRTGEPLDAGDAADRLRMGDLLAETMTRQGTEPPTAADNGT